MNFLGKQVKDTITTTSSQDAEIDPFDACNHLQEWALTKLCDFTQKENIVNCEIRNSYFNGSHVPSYSSSEVRWHYVLKYGYAYSLEYAFIYSSILDDMISNEDLKKINILSFGCGPYFDCIGFLMASTDNKFGSLVNGATYYGVDQCDWKDCLERLEIKFKLPQIKFENMNIQNINPVYFKDKNIFFFPKIISELENSVWIGLVNHIKSNATEEIFYIAISLPKAADYIRTAEDVEEYLKKEFCDMGIVMLQSDFTEESIYVLANRKFQKKYSLDDDLKGKMGKIHISCRHETADCKKNNCPPCGMSAVLCGKYAQHFIFKIKNKK